MEEIQYLETQIQVHKERKEWLASTYKNNMAIEDMEIKTLKARINNLK